MTENDTATDESTEPETVEAKAEEPKQTQHRSHAGLWFMVVLVLLLQLGMVGAGAYVYFEFKPRLALSHAPGVNAPSVGKIRALQTAFNDLSERLQALEKNWPDAQQAGLSEQQLQQRMNQSLRPIRQQIQALKQQQQAQPATDIQAVLNELENERERLEQMRKEFEALRQELSVDSRSHHQLIQLLTAFEQLEHAINHERSYRDSLHAFELASRALPGAGQWVSVLKRYQHEGVPTYEDIISRFEAAHEAAISPNVPDDGDLLGQMQQNMAELVTIRKIGPTHEGDDIESILARAEHALMMEDVPALRQELDTLPIAKKPLFTPVMQAIKRREQVENTLREMRAAIQQYQQRVLTSS